MISKQARNVLAVGIFVLIVIIAFSFIGFFFECLPEDFHTFSSALRLTLPWSLPLIVLVFFSPYIIAYTQRYDVEMRFQMQGDDALLVTIVNKGATPFSFNRVQLFSLSKAKPVLTPWMTSIYISMPEKEMDLLTEPNWDAGLTIRKGIPMKLLLQGRHVPHILENGSRPYYLKLYYEHTPMSVDSKGQIPHEFIESCRRLSRMPQH